MYQSFEIWGITWIISSRYPHGSLHVFYNLKTSSFFISSSNESRIMYPLGFQALICWPAIPTRTSEKHNAWYLWTSSTVSLMAFTVSSMFWTTPLLTPFEGALLSRESLFCPFSFFCSDDGKFLCSDVDPATYCSLFIHSLKYGFRFISVYKQSGRECRFIIELFIHPISGRTFHRILQGYSASLQNSQHFRDDRMTAHPWDQSNFIMTIYKDLSIWADQKLLLFI